jgi:hypothetical protein
MVMLYKSCSAFHKESNKIGFAFYYFFMIFYAFYKNQQNCKHYLRINFRTGPWEVFQIHKYTLSLQIGPWKEVAPRNWALGHRPPALRPNSGEPTAEAGRARAEGDLRGLLGLILMLGWGRGATGGARPAEQGGYRRGSACSGKAAANACWPASRASLVGACGGDVGPTRCREVQRRELGCGRPWRQSKEGHNGAFRREGEGAPLL